MPSSSSSSVFLILSALLVVFIHGVSGRDVIKSACEQVADRKASARCIHYFRNLPKSKTKNMTVLTETAIRSTLDLATKMEDALQANISARGETARDDAETCLTVYQTANGAIQNALMSYISKDFDEAKSQITEASSAPEVCDALFVGEEGKALTYARLNKAYRHFTLISQYFIKSFTA